jgi:iron only hydrogenase large subunit-like protein
MQECPFGAIIPSSVLPDIIKDIKSGEKVIALVAPSIAGQFRDKLSQIYGSIKQLGFSEIVEVAWGAELTAEHESQELIDMLEKENSTPLISSCCPSWVDFAKKCKSDLEQYISTTPSPLVYTAKKVREKFSDAKLVFIAPCIAKKRETALQTDCEYCISFEELGAYFVAAGIEISEQDEVQAILSGNIMAKNFAEAGGVANAVKSSIDKEVRIAAIDGLSKVNQRIINQMLKKREFDFLEVMGCEGGCLGGCQSLTSPNEGKQIFNKSK